MSTDRLRVLVVDDEPLARAGLTRMLAAHADLELAGECSDGSAAIDSIESSRPDLVLLDVEMPELSGFEVLRAVGPDAMPAVIFVTAFDKYAVDAFEAGALDYVLKPVDPERLNEALERARGDLRNRNRAPMETKLRELLLRLAEREGFAKRIVVKGGGRVQFVQVTEIDWIEAADNYVKIHADERSLLHRETLASLERVLDPVDFVRIHRSTIVRMDRVRELRPVARGDALLTLVDGTQLPVSRRFRSRIEDASSGP